MSSQQSDKNNAESTKKAVTLQKDSTQRSPDELSKEEEDLIRENVKRAANSWLVLELVRRVIEQSQIDFQVEHPTDSGSLAKTLFVEREIPKNLVEALLKGFPIETERKMLTEILRSLENQFKKRIVGQDDLVRTVLISLILDEHALLEGLPGVGKTEMVKWIAHVTGLPFSRVQFIPDMLPSDLIGKDRVDLVKLERKDPDAIQWVNGPIFTSILLADEINRAPSKVQAALLEAMGEKQVTPFGKISRPVLSPLHQAALETWPSKSPDKGGLLGLRSAIPVDRKDLAQFTVFATMNPIEQEGTYPLSEAQIDRFCFKSIVPYPPRNWYSPIERVVYSGEKPPDAVELNVTPEKCEEYFKKHPRHMIPFLLPLYFFLRCRANVLPVKLAGELIVAEPLLYRLYKPAAGTAPRDDGESPMGRSLHDSVYITNARTERLGETEGAVRWYDREQVEMRDFIYNKLEGPRADKLKKILQQDHCQYVKAGGSPRGFLKLTAASLCSAFLAGRDEVKEEDIISVIDNVLRHRIHMDVHARLAGVRPEDVVHKVCEIILASE